MSVTAAQAWPSMAYKKMLVRGRARVKKFSQKVNQDIREQCRGHYAAALTEQDADEIAANVSAFFDLLASWSTKCQTIEEQQDHR